MRRKLIIYALPAIVLVFFAFSLYNSGTREKVLLELLSKSLSFNHYSKFDLDKNRSQKIYDLYIEDLDGRKIYLLKEDIDQLSKYRTKLDVEIKNTSFDFFDLSVQIIDKRIKETELIYKEILGKPFDFNQDDNIELDPEKLEFPKNAKERYDRWYKLLKYQTLARLDDVMARQEKAIKEKDTTFKILEFATLEKNAREKVAEDYKTLFHRIFQLDEKDRLSSYLNAITESLDPHSEYMPPKVKEQFDINMTGKLEGIGAQLQEQNGYIKVARIIPGSPSWKQGILKAGDIILKVAQGDAEPLSIVDMRLDDAVQFIRGKKGTEVRLTVKKPDGSIILISLIRDVVIIEESFAKSALVTINGSGRKYGYIYLPSFYTDFSDRKARRCATDVALEIEKMKKDEVGGIIIDLRNNGGGSLPDAVEMSGLFIKDGPIVQVKTREDKPIILTDNDSRIQFDGELVIMVNILSASASEIMAAAMQDYGRAVIVGASSTYGKGTVQTFIELDKFLNNSLAQYKPLGELKLTIQKFYRINGGSTQLKGVVPDIVLPDLYSSVEIGEKEQENAMQWDEIAPCSYTKWQLPISNMQQIKDLSRARTDKNDNFKLIKQNAERLKALSLVTKYSLNLKTFREQQAKLNEESKKYDKVNDVSTQLVFKSLSTDNMAMLNDTVKIGTLNAWHHDLAKDIYLEEAVHILQDIK